VYCQKNGVDPAQVLALLAKGEIPAFIMDKLAKTEFAKKEKYFIRNS
jgi:hypothetical protein